MQMLVTIALIFFLTSNHYCAFVTGDVKGIVGEGMPLPKSPFEHGNLFIKFDVAFPSNQFADGDKLKVRSFLVFWSRVHAIIA